MAPYLHLVGYHGLDVRKRASFSPLMEGHLRLLAIQFGWHWGHSSLRTALFWSSTPSSALALTAPPVCASSPNKALSLLELLPFIGELLPCPHENSGARHHQGKMKPEWWMLVMRMLPVSHTWSHKMNGIAAMRLRRSCKQSSPTSFEQAHSQRFYDI